MSRLAFDDIFKSSPSVGPGNSRAGKKSRSSEKKEDLSQFDDTFKQVVKELHANDSSRSKEKLDSKTEAKATGNVQKSTADSDGESTSESDIEEQVVDPTAGADDQGENEDDALIAQVMAEAAEHEKEAELLGDVVDGDAVVAMSGDKLAGQAVLAAGSEQTNILQGVEASIVTAGEASAATSATTMVAGETDVLQSSAESSEQTNIITSEIVIPQDAAGTEATQAMAAATAVTTTNSEDAGIEAAETASGNFTAEASASIQVSQKSEVQQDSSDAGQDAEEGAAQNAQDPQLSTVTGSPVADGEALKAEADKSKKESTVSTTPKVEGLHERSAATMGQEGKPAQGVSSSTAPQTTESSVDTTDRIRFIERVAQAFQAQSSGNGTIRMRLHPDELGAIKIEITVRNGAMHARVETETQEARHLLMDNLPALRERLATHNIKVQQFDIDYNSGGDQQNLSHGPEDWADANQHRSNHANENNMSSEEGDAEENVIHRAASVIGSGEQLDVTA